MDGPEMDSGPEMDIVVCNGLIGSVMDIVGLQWIQRICNGYTGSVIGVMGLC